jgi:predicted DNA-binding transcriptional regulator AlpA
MTNSGHKHLCGAGMEGKEEKPELPQVRLLTIKEVSGHIGFTPAYIYKKIKEGKFPKSFKFGRSARWKLSDILEWIDEHQSN